MKKRDQPEKESLGPAGTRLETLGALKEGKSREKKAGLRPGGKNGPIMFSIGGKKEGK